LKSMPFSGTVSELSNEYQIQKVRKSDIQERNKDSRDNTPI